MLDLWRLRILRELAFRETMSAAAASLRLTTSAVSQHIARLEKEAGSPLLHRRGRTVELTHAGRLLAFHAAKILADLDEAESELAALRHEPTGTVSVAAFPSAALALLPACIGRLREAHPSLRVTVRDLEPRETVAALYGGQVDVGIIDDLELLAELSDPGIETTGLGRDHLVAVLPAEHRLADADVIHLGELAGDDWLLDDDATPFYQLVVRAARAEGVVPRITAHCRNGLLTVALVEAGCGISVIPHLWQSQLAGSEVVVKPLVPRVERALVLAYRRGFERHPNIAAVLRQLRETAAGLGIE